KITPKHDYRIEGVILTWIESLARQLAKEGSLELEDWARLAPVMAFIEETRLEAARITSVDDTLSHLTIRLACSTTRGVITVRQGRRRAARRITPDALQPRHPPMRPS